MKGARVDAGALFALILLCTAYTFPRWADWNQNSRFDLTVAIVDHGTLSIDCCVGNTGDFAIVDGRAYSDKAPGLSLLAVPAYFLFRAIASLPPVESLLMRLAHGEALQGTLRESGTGLLLEKVRFALGMTFATLAVVSVPSALACVAFYFFLARFFDGRGPRVAVTVAYALATIAFTYAGAFYAHQLVASLLFFSFCLASRGAAGWTRLELAGLGLMLGLAVISEYPAVLIAAAIALVVAVRAPVKGELVWALAGASLPLALGAAYDYSVFGTPLPVGYRYSALWQERHSTGFISLTYPHLEALWGITFSRFRGLFLLSPVLLLSLPGWARLWRSHPIETGLSAWAVLSFLAFNSSSAMWWGGFAVGPRYLVPMLPFLAWPMIAFLSRSEAKQMRAALCATLLAVSLALVWGLSLAEQQFPPDGLFFPWREWAWPNLQRGNLARNAGMLLGLHGWVSLLPLIVGVAMIGTAWRWLGRRA